MIRAEDADAFVEQLPVAQGMMGPSPGRRRSLGQAQAPPRPPRSL
jgi:hypothetical protein